MQNLHELPGGDRQIAKQQPRKEGKEQNAPRPSKEQSIRHPPHPVQQSCHNQSSKFAENVKVRGAPSARLVLLSRMLQ